VVHYLPELRAPLAALADAPVTTVPHNGAQMFGPQQPDWHW
jgi:hypothetical protein